MTTIISVFFLIIFLWTGHSAEWRVDYATGLAQLAIWCTLASLVPFLSLWVSLKESTFREIPRTNLRTHWSSFLKYSATLEVGRLPNLIAIYNVAMSVENHLFSADTFCLFLNHFFGLSTSSFCLLRSATSCIFFSCYAVLRSCVFFENTRAKAEEKKRAALCPLVFVENKRTNVKPK